MRDTLLILGRQGIPVAAAGSADPDVADPFASGRRIAFQDEAGFSTGHVFIDGEMVLHDLPYAEVIVLTSGSIATSSRTFTKGEAFVLPRGFSGRLNIAPNTQWFFCLMAGGVVGGAQIPIPLDAALARPSSPGPAPEVLIGPKPDTHALNLFTDSSGMRAGVWDVMSPCERSIVHHRVHELMHLIEGEVTLTHVDGTKQSFRAGDTIFVPRGAPYAWKNDMNIIKYYVVL